VVRTKTAGPPLLTPARVPQLALVLAGAVCLGVGGERFATLWRPPRGSRRRRELDWRTGNRYVVAARSRRNRGV